MPCRPMVMQPIIHPTKCCDIYEVERIQVPHIHPTHTTCHHHTIYEHMHMFPHTTSNVSNVSNQHFSCGGPGMMPMAGMPGPQPVMAPGMPGPQVGPWR